MHRFLVALPLVFVAACQGGASDGAGDDLVGWTRTLVEAHADGTPPTVTERWIEAGTREAAGVDPTCANSAGHLFSKSNFAGAELCLSGADDFVLADYTFRVCGRFDCYRVRWAKNVRSLASGDISGMLYEGAYPNFACQDLIEPHQPLATQDACMKIAERYDQGLTGIP